MAVTRKKDSCRVLAVDSYPFVLESYGVILKEIPAITLVGTAKDGLEAVEKHSSLKPHLIIIDENVPGLSGTEATRQIRQTDGEVKILFYTGHSAGAELAFLAGANGFLTKDAPLTSLLAAIEALRSGGIYVEQRAWGPLRSRFLAADPDMPMLTEEEMLVVPLLRAGHSSKEIADLLGLKIRRVEKIRGRLMHKTHSANTTAFVAKLGLYTPARSPQPVGI